MSLGKKNISKEISSKAQISYVSSRELLQSFIKILLTQSQFRPVKISKFGVFFKKITPQRVGRNPKTLENFIISERNKLIFSPSNKVKTKLN